jgi:hypothetical protein
MIRAWHFKVLWLDPNCIILTETLNCHVLLSDMPGRMALGNPWCGETDLSAWNSHTSIGLQSKSQESRSLVPTLF